MPPTPASFAISGLAVVMGLLAALLAFAVMRLYAASRAARRTLSERSSETALLSAALQDAVTRLKQQEQQSTARAHASERLSAQIVQSLTSGLLLVSATGTVRIANPAARRILGLGALSLPAPLDEVLAGAAPLAALVREQLAGAPPISRGMLALGPGPGPSHLGVTLSPLPGEAGQPPGLACLFTDLSEVVALQEQLHLKEALARVGELTGGIAHEFRNGLATIHGYARLLDPGKLPAPQGGYVAAIRAETQTLGEVVTRFLQFARPERPNLTPVDLGAVVGRAAAETDAPDGAIAVAGAFGWIDGDDVLLRQAFANLLRNALEACTEAGTAPQVRVTGELRAAEGVVRVTVRDNGPGLPAESRDRLFRPFVTTRSRGTGLGLALVQKFVVIHDGQVKAGDAPGGGAEFVVQLPLRPGAGPNPPRG